MSYELSKRLLKWFDANGRGFFWRAHSDRYIVLIAEILLKRTTANTVDRFLPLFLKHYPDMLALHDGSLTDLQKLLSPLGLSEQRATQLKSLAEILVNCYGGEIPCEKEDLLKLPGIGSYIAGSLLSFACNKPEPIVDTNIARVLTRLYGLKPSRYEARRSLEVWEKARELICERPKEAAKINWAILDLGALICKPKRPAHGRCPLEDCCVSSHDSC